MRSFFSKISLFIIIVVLGIALSACSNPDDVSPEKVQAAIAETQQASAMVETLVAETMNALPTEAPPTHTPEPLPPAYDYSTWKGYHAPDGYAFYFPTRFNMEIRQGGSGEFIVLIAEGDPPNAVSFSVQKLSGSLDEIKNGVDLDNTVYTDLAPYSMTGFIVEGTVPGDGFGGGSVVYESYFALGDFLLQLDCPWNYCDRQEFDLILRSFKLE